MTFFFIDKDHTLISDGAFLTIPADPGNFDYKVLLANNVEIEPFDAFRGLDLGGAKARILGLLEAETAALRARVAGTVDPTKLAAYQQKYETAIAAQSGDAAALSLLADEAQARGLTAAELATLVQRTGDQWRTLVQRIEAASAQHKARIAALTSVEAAKGYDWTLRIEGL